MQLDLFSPPPTVFPWHKRTAVLRDIADTFVLEGFDAGNARMNRYGCLMIAELFRAGVMQAEMETAIGKFHAAWREITIPRMVEQHRERKA